MAFNGRTQRDESVGDQGSNPRVIMWCTPRSVSTALAKCLSFVEGAEIYLDPYVMSKLVAELYRTVHPDGENFPFELEGNEQMYREAAGQFQLFGGDLDEQDLTLLSPILLKRRFEAIDPKKKLIFIKDMAFGMPSSRYQYLPDKSSGFKHFFLIRNPIKSYKSFRKAILDIKAVTADESDQPDPKTFHVFATMPRSEDGTPYFFKAIHELWSHVRKTVDDDPVIVDGDDLLSDPSAMLPRLCHALGIPYSESLLAWEESSDIVLKWKSCCPNVRDAPRYSMWFATAFKSTHFTSSGTSATLEGATADVVEMVKKDMPYYEEMYNHRLTIL